MHICWQAMLVHMLKGGVGALTHARHDKYDIDLKNDVVMRAAPRLPLMQGPSVHYTAELAKYMHDKRYKSFLTELVIAKHVTPNADSCPTAPV